MAWNPDPEVAALRDYAKKFNRPIVVVLSIHAGGERLQMVTFGKTKELCKLAQSLGDKIADAVSSGVIAAPDVEPAGEPIHATLWERVRPLTTEAETAQDAKP